MTPKENYMIAARGGKPEYVPLFPRDCNVFRPEFWKKMDPVTGVDFLNIKWVTNDAGAMPEPGRKAMEDIFQWRETAKWPDLATMDWESIAENYNETRDPDKVDICLLNTFGIFLIPINMMGWAETLCTICEEPEELECFVARITEFLVELTGYVGKYIHPDIVMTGDDFAAAGGPFLSKSTFRKIYRPYIEKINRAIHEIGALVEFHCCGNCQYLTSEFIEAGADIVQLPEPNEQLLADKKKFGSRMVMTGGWDRHGPGCAPNASEEVVRESVRVAIDTYGKDGALIFWDGGVVGSSEDSMNKREWINDEVEKYGAVVYRERKPATP